MKLDVVASSGNDEFYTPPYAVAAIMGHVPLSATIWCPFDTDKSHFVRMFRDRGNVVIATHLENGFDFFSYTPDVHFDYVISNPPYSAKTEVLERLFSMDVKFAMLVGVVGLFESQRRFEMFRDNNFEIMYLNRRVAYFKNYEEQKPSLNPPFSSVYLARGVFPNRIQFSEINKALSAPINDTYEDLF